ncbi:class I SAM-dependent methyltransferase [bacterium]|nr:class I SAM-dependent methyltransferase [bacterium]
MSSEQHIASAIAELGLSIHESRVSRLAHFVDLLLEYNKRTSLTALKTGEEVVRNLLADSLAASMAMGFDLSRECLDLGAGGGFPSIVLSIAFDGKAWVAVERNKRKAAYLKAVARSLAIERYTVMPSDLCQIAYSQEMTQRFHLVTIRGVRLDTKIIRAIKSVAAPGASIIRYGHGVDESLLRVYCGARCESQGEKSISAEAMGRRIRIEHDGYDEFGGDIEA